MTLPQGVIIDENDVIIFPIPADPQTGLLRQGQVNEENWSWHGRTIQLVIGIYFLDDNGNRIEGSQRLAPYSVVLTVNDRVRVNQLGKVVPPDDENYSEDLPTEYKFYCELAKTPYSFYTAVAQACVDAITSNRYDI